MAQKKTFKPQNLRMLLSLLMIVVVLGGGGLFYMGLNTVRDFADEVNRRGKDADASGKQIEQLQVLKGQLAESESLVSKADQIFGTPAGYQSQILTDLKTYASQVGLGLGSTDFSDPKTTGAYTVDVKFSQSVINYSQLIQFLSLTESNLPKMQTISIELSHPQNASANTVQVGTIKFNVSVRQV